LCQENRPLDTEKEDKSVLSRKDYLKVLYLTVAFEKAKETNNRKAMDDAACQAALIRQKPEYNGKYESQWENGDYKKTYEPSQGFNSVYRHVSVHVNVFESISEVEQYTGEWVNTLSNALFATGASRLDMIGNIASILGLLPKEDQDILNQVYINWAVVGITIQDYYGYGKNLESSYLVNPNYVAKRHQERVVYAHRN